jgi:hypothetical protein
MGDDSFMVEGSFSLVITGYYSVDVGRIGKKIYGADSTGQPVD